MPTPYQDVADPNLHAPLLVPLFTAEFCRLHGWAREEPLDVVVDLGGRGGALSMIEKGRRVMGDRLGDVREWKELPVCLASGCQHSANMHADGDTSAFGAALSLRVRLSCFQGSRHRFKPSTNACLRPCYCGRELQASAQGQVRIYAASLDKWRAADLTVDGRQSALTVRWKRLRLRFSDCTFECWRLLRCKCMSHETSKHNCPPGRTCTPIF